MPTGGKKVKGKSAKAKKAEKKSNASEAEKRLQMRVQKMKDSDFRKKLWHKRRAELKVRSLTLSTTTTTTTTHTHTHTGFPGKRTKTLKDKSFENTKSMEKSDASC